VNRPMSPPALPALRASIRKAALGTMALRVLGIGIALVVAGWMATFAFQFSISTGGVNAYPQPATWRTALQCALWWLGWGLLIGGGAALWVGRAYRDGKYDDLKARLETLTPEQRAAVLQPLERVRFSEIRSLAMDLGKGLERVDASEVAPASAPEGGGDEVTAGEDSR
jgi:hypothetical protein